MELVAAIVLALGLCWMLGRDDAHLRRRARRYRELRFEGGDELRRDPYPEQAQVRGGFLRGPDGRATDADRVLEVELEVAREYTRSLRSRKGAECQL